MKENFPSGGRNVMFQDYFSLINDPLMPVTEKKGHSAILYTSLSELVIKNLPCPYKSREYRLIKVADRSVIFRHVFPTVWGLYKLI